MKRVLLLSALIMLICTGCVSEKHRNGILEALSEEDVITDEWHYISMEKISSSPIPDIREYVYTYSQSGDIYNVVIHNSQVSDDGNDSYWPVDIYSDVVAKETEDTDVSGNTVTVVSYANSGTIYKRYYVRRHSVLFWDWYTLEERTD